MSNHEPTSAACPNCGHDDPHRGGGIGVCQNPGCGCEDRTPTDGHPDPHEKHPLARPGEGSHGADDSPHSLPGHGVQYAHRPHAAGAAHPAATTTTTTTHQMPPLSALAETRRESDWETLVHAAAGERGPAVAALTRHVRLAQPSIERVHAAWLSVQLLQHEDIDTCHTVAVLIDDGWNGTLGELLACARDL